MSNSAGGSKSTATEICINLRLNASTAASGKYFVHFINWNFPTKITLEVETLHAVVPSTGSVHEPVLPSA